MYFLIFKFFSTSNLIIMKEEKRQKLIETLIVLGGIVGAFLSVFPLINEGTIQIFAFFIVFSLLYYICTLEGLFSKKYKYKRGFLKYYKFFIVFSVSATFSSIFISLLIRGMTSTGIIGLIVLAVFLYPTLSLVLTLSLGDYGKEFRYYTDKIINVFKTKKKVKGNEREDS